MKIIVKYLYFFFIVTVIGLFIGLPLILLTFSIKEIDNLVDETLLPLAKYLEIKKK